MKQEIKNPFKVNYILYILLLVIFFALLCYSVILELIGEHKVITEILKDISISSIASVLVALFIEISNVREKNKKVNNTYISIYSEVRFSVIKYVEIWSVLCKLFDKKSNYKNEKHTWTEWYDIIKEYVNNLDSKECCEITERIIPFLKSEIEYVNKSLDIIISQKQLLEINNIYNSDMNGIVNDFKFEFNCAKMELESKDNIKNFWKSFDALNKDITVYINNWSDIRFLNILKFKPNKVLDDKEELLKAMMLSSSII